ncbi:MAG TPA: DUF1223 domain-containing protein [Hyphomicrobiaceae bacterium]|nr:DUF1223 domain-containing protein [Hyphomicrobiaceae bacterium]
MRSVALIGLAVGFVSGSELTLGAQAEGAGAAASGAPPVAVVELYTSQGCSSCPTADALLARLAGRAEVVALSLPVDYWDYLGWRDTLANSKYTERQRAYAKARGDGAIYTPQAVINGLAHVNGGDEGEILQAIERTSKLVAAQRVPVQLSEVKGKLVVEASAAPPGTAVKDATLWLAIMSPKVEVSIGRGENQGRKITYTNVVRELMPIGSWSGKALTVELERQAILRPGADRCAVLLQQGHAGPIVGAALMNHF